MQVEGDEYFKNFVKPILAQEGDKLPVSAIAADGVVPTGTTKLREARHRREGSSLGRDQLRQVQPVLSGLPACRDPSVPRGRGHRSGFLRHQKALGKAVRRQAFRIQVSPLDCTGCGNCVDVCLARGA